MYDFYPEWGPARHRDDNDVTSAEAWDDTSDRPDDN